MSSFSNVLLVSDLKSNLLSLGELCDSQYEEHLSLNECVIVDKKGKNVFHDKRTSDNCYVVATDSDIMCNTARSSDTDLWHQ